MRPSTTTLLPKLGTDNSVSEVLNPLIDTAEVVAQNCHITIITYSSWRHREGSNLLQRNVLFKTKQTCHLLQKSN